jgi:hypothetical protein
MIINKTNVLFDRSDFHHILWNMIQSVGKVKILAWNINDSLRLIVAL